MKRFLLAAILAASSSQAFAYNLGIFSIDYFDMRYEKFADARDPYAPQYDNNWLYRVATDFNISAGPLYWSNDVHMETIETQTPKTVGWQYELGLHLLDNIDVYREHHSRHIMDEYSPDQAIGENDLPVEDVYGIRFKIIDDPAHKTSVSKLIFGK